ncbi:hypothetical protein G9A89_007571 [Geosiphon pyriformis]|nr:hypothetical protein G9A89_007571 [Geosiphon pyriformis]
MIGNCSGYKKTSRRKDGRITEEWISKDEDRNEKMQSNEENFPWSKFKPHGVSCSRILTKRPFTSGLKKYPFSRFYV